MREAAAVRSALLRWYRRNARDLPFRRTRDPYGVLVAEVALQQTQVVTGVPFVERFLERFPDVRSLAEAADEEVLLAWEGLGYYRRATALQAAARAIVNDHGARVPSDYDALLNLPGVGPYTAGAVASIAFGRRVPAVDGNAARVLSRLFLLDEDPAAAAGLKRYREHAAALMGNARPGDFNQALMELGATVCRPRSPRCDECPLATACHARLQGRIEEFPPPRQATAVAEVEVAFALVERAGRVLAVRRGKGSLLAGMWALPGGEVRDADGAEGTLRQTLRRVGLRLESVDEIHRRRKVFSSRVWDARVYRCKVAGRVSPAEHARWFAPRDRAKVPFVPFQREILDGLEL